MRTTGASETGGRLDRDVALARDLATARRWRFDVAPTRRAVASWGAAEPGTLRARGGLASGATTPWATLADLGGGDGARAPRSRDDARGPLIVATDELRLAEDAVWFEFISDGDVTGLTLATSRHGDGASVLRTHDAHDARDARPAPGTEPVTLPITPRSQYVGDARGWCLPTSLAMLLAFHGVTLATAEVARALADPETGSTGNWSFAASFAARRGFGAVAYLPGLAAVRRFVAAGFPLAVSLAWARDAFPEGPLPARAGHLVVVAGFDRAGDAIVADPAQPELVVTYPARRFERLWLGHGGVAIIVGRAGDADALLALANAR